ncbi:restriction endonuclease subunit S [Mangrovibacterium diazotrophicum]|uniref:Type I restriction enzyme S subunit n=1 Tax=Mangrovibacterium diazotrophicum TaxID=1261403 RepID=A0A419W3I4_9BACT|nr:restriction endonuclease subunit S [Mangrovibacterium diazotrophicum]RKD90036.1 type I restriction enzyme S subunit [Mangrovibacterium diazotrophicum]
MKRYEKYKDSGIEWLGEIPENWKVVKIKHVLDNLNHRRIPLSSVERGDMTEHIYDYYGASGVIDKVDNFLFDEETILIGEDGANLLSRSKRLAFIASGKYWVNNHAHILKPKDGSIIYFSELLETIDYTPLIVGAAQPKLTQESLMNIEVIEPPKDEQTAIASYLDHKTAQIDALIEKKEQLIEKLKEQRQAIINEAVTKGLNPKAPLKDSGIEWLREIPEHWETTKLKYIGESITGITYSPDDVVDSGEYHKLVLRSSNIQDGKLELTNNVYVNKEINPKYYTQNGDILICSRNGSRDLIGKNIKIDERVSGETWGAFMTVFRSEFNDFVYYFFNSQIFKALSSLFLSSTINQLTIGVLNEFVIALPKDKEEQKKIVKYLNEKTSSLDDTIFKVQISIEKFKLYRQSLISEAVTGKIDVRDWETITTN